MADYLKGTRTESETITEETPLPDEPPSTLGSVVAGVVVNTIEYDFELLANRIESESTAGPQKALSLRFLDKARRALG